MLTLAVQSQASLLVPLPKLANGLSPRVLNAMGSMPIGPTPAELLRISACSSACWLSGCRTPRRCRAKRTGWLSAQRPVQQLPAAPQRRCSGDGLELPQQRQGHLFERGGDRRDLLPQRLVLERSSVFAQAALQLGEVLAQGCG
jgi:hypothetical protein